MDDRTVRKYNRIWGMTGLAAKAGKIAAGARACEEAVRTGRIFLVMIAEDAANNTTEGIEKLCIRNDVPYMVIGKIETFGDHVGRSGIAVLGITDTKLADRIKQIYDPKD
ncbi:hypothetical protein EOM86_10720 [Candidatus Nomurabacteria bacterium]|nr:hypothetical protein [Candidatus Nomurabacteria bacterium]